MRWFWRVLIVILSALSITAAIGAAMSYRTEVVLWNKVKEVPFGRFVGSSLKPSIRLSLKEGVFCIDLVRMTLNPPADWNMDPGYGWIRGLTGQPEVKWNAILFQWTYQRYGDVRFDKSNYTGMRTTSAGHLAVQMWALSALFMICPAIAYIRGPYRRSRRRKGGLCVNCGYSLTGLTEPRCPECGERI